MMTTEHNGMTWPGIKSKIWPITIVRVPGWAFSIIGPEEYYGGYFAIHFGPWILFAGSGLYVAKDQAND
jgi:hypothetical protein